MNSKKVIDDIIYYAELCFDRFLTSSLGGNISVKVDDKIYITATNTCFKTLRPDEIVICDLKGITMAINALGEPTELKPSKEALLHAEVLSLKPSANCVIHVHPPYSVAFSHCNMEIPMITGGARVKLKRVPIIPEADSNTPELFAYVKKTLIENDSSLQAYVMQNHGTIVTGQSIQDAFAITDLVEDTAKLAYIMKTLKASLVTPEVHDHM